MRAKTLSILFVITIIFSVPLIGQEVFAQVSDDVIVTKNIFEGCSASCSEGDFVNFEILVTDDVVGEGQALQITDLIPSSLEITGTNVPLDSTYDENTGIWDIDQFSAPPSNIWRLEIYTDIKPGTCGQTITNTATLTNTPNFNSNPDNDEDSVSFDVTTLATGAGCEVGGLGVPIDTTVLLLASAQSMTLWMIPVIAGIGIGIFVIKKKF